MSYDYEAIEALEALERDDDGLTEGQRDRIAFDIRQFNANGWPQVIDGIAKGTGFSRIEIILMWISFNTQHTQINTAQTEKSNNEVRELCLELLTHWKKEMDEESEWQE